MSGTSMTRSAVDRPLAAGGGRSARPGPRRTGSRAGPPRPAAAAGRGPGAARRPGRSRRSRRCPAGRGRRVRRGGQADRDRQVGGRLAEPGAADGGGEDVLVVQPEPAVLLEHRDHHRHPRGVEARDGAPRLARRRRRSPGPAPRRAAAGGPPCSPRRRCRAPAGRGSRRTARSGR